MEVSLVDEPELLVFRGTFKLASEPRGTARSAALASAEMVLVRLPSNSSCLSFTLVVCVSLLGCNVRLAQQVPTACSYHKGCDISSCIIVADISTKAELACNYGSDQFFGDILHRTTPKVLHSWSQNSASRTLSSCINCATPWVGSATECRSKCSLCHASSIVQHSATRNLQCNFAILSALILLGQHSAKGLSYTVVMLTDMHLTPI